MRPSKRNYGDGGVCLSFAVFRPYPALAASVLVWGRWTDAGPESHAVGCKPCSTFSSNGVLG